MLQVNISCFEI